MNHLNRSHGSKVMAKTAKWVKTGLSATRTHGCDSHPDLSFSGNNNYPVRPALVDATRTQFYHFLEIANTQCDPYRPVRPAPAKSRDCSDDRWITAGTSRCTWVRSAPMDATRSGSNQWPRFTVQDTETRVRLAPEPHCFGYKRDSGQNFSF